MENNAVCTTADRVFLSRAELAEALGTNLSTVNGWASRSPLVPFPRPAKQRRNEFLYDRDDLVSWFLQQSKTLDERGQDWWASYFRNHYQTLTATDR
ncbi:MAG: hypothetical protein AB7L13_15750 [Acidimicrobiia bacterium]